MLSSRSTLDTVTVGSDRVRIGPWRADAHVALVAPLPGRPLSAAAVSSCIDAIRRRGFHAALTTALAGAETQGFLTAGFHVRERLHLLRHHLAPVPQPTPWPTRRARTSDRAAALAIDEAAFDEFWRLDLPGLGEARAATPSSRFRVVADGRDVVGYAVTGRAGAVGYLQRLAVRPDRQHRGIGSALVVDALSWARRRHAASVLVNTQHSNAGAFALYTRLGFVPEPDGLAVLAWHDGAER